MTLSFIINKMKSLHFKSRAAYKRWLAFGHIHKKFRKHGAYPRILIKGHIHKVMHRIP